MGYILVGLLAVTLIICIVFFKTLRKDFRYVSGKEYTTSEDDYYKAHAAADMSYQVSPLYIETVNEDCTFIGRRYNMDGTVSEETKKYKLVNIKPNNKTFEKLKELEGKYIYYSYSYQRSGSKTYNSSEEINGWYSESPISDDIKTLEENQINYRYILKGYADFDTDTKEIHFSLMIKNIGKK